MAQVTRGRDTVFLYDVPQAWKGFDDTDILVVDPVRLSSWTYEADDDETLRRLRRDRAAMTEAVKNVNIPSIPDKGESFLPTVAALDALPAFYSKTSTGSRRYDGLAHRTDEWHNYEGSSRQETRPGEYPAVIAFRREQGTGADNGDIERDVYKEEEGVIPRVFDMSDSLFS